MSHLGSNQSPDDSSITAHKISSNKKGCGGDNASCITHQSTDMMTFHSDLSMVAHKIGDERTKTCRDYTSLNSHLINTDNKTLNAPVYSTITHMLQTNQINQTFEEPQLPLTEECLNANSSSLASHQSSSNSPNFPGSVISHQVIESVDKRDVVQEGNISSEDSQKINITHTEKESQEHTSLTITENTSVLNTEMKPTDVCEVVENSFNTNDDKNNTPSDISKESENCGPDDKSFTDHRQNIQTEENEIAQKSNKSLERSISLGNDSSSKVESVPKSSSSISLKSESESQSERDTSLDNSLSSIISSPATKGKARPKVLRNFQLSSFTGESQEKRSKYLPPPRLRKASDFVVPNQKQNQKPPKKPLRRKTRRNSEEESDSSIDEKIPPPPPPNPAERKKNRNSRNLDTFEFKFVGLKESVQVVGSFNNWTPEDLFCISNGVWSKHVHLDKGTYLFR